MQRRSFLATSPLIAAAPLVASPAPNRQYLELIAYHTQVGTRKSMVVDFYRDVALPAYGRLGIGPVGVFTPQYGPNQPTVYVLVPHASLEQAAAINQLLLEDATFVQDGAEFLNASLTSPAYVRQTRQLMVAFKDMPTVEMPVNGADRIFELRIYESHSIRAGQTKIHMFNEGGEIALFRKIGLHPVFFGETLFGPMMPNLTYMLGFSSMSERDDAWRRFIDDPEWHAMRDNPMYADTVSNITDFILRPAPFSQI
ncbi:MAG: NIPSNAP family protein [Bacteroidota bacterium]|nr:NIPSNAP family protein [Bacteroidota bacterium]MDE2834372.1 NIPSNAP family protein [Bacteroidota bacterium]